MTSSVSPAGTEGEDEEGEGDCDVDEDDDVGSSGTRAASRGASSADPSGNPPLQSALMMAR